MAAARIKEADEWLALETAFRAGFDCGVCAEGGGDRNHWSESMKEAENQSFEAFKEGLINHANSR